MPAAGPASLPPLSPHLQPTNGYPLSAGPPPAGSPAARYGGPWSPAPAPASSGADRHATLSYTPNMAPDRPPVYCECSVTTGLFNQPI